jgi:hypothetical protein
MQIYGGVDVWFHVFLTSALVGDVWSASPPGRFTPEKIIPRYALERRLSGHQSQSGRRKFFTLTELEIRPLSRRARSQSLYRLTALSRLLCVSRRVQKPRSWIST